MVRPKSGISVIKWPEKPEIKQRTTAISAQTVKTDSGMVDERECVEVSASVKITNTVCAGYRLHHAYITNRISGNR